MAPSSTIATGFSTLIACRGASCSTIPAHSIRNTNGAALPSMIGTSGPSSSTIALSTAAPAKAAIRCSTVPTIVPPPSDSIVQRVESTAFSHTARISAPVSVRRKTIPVPATAGTRLIATRCPE